MGEITVAALTLAPAGIGGGGSDALAVLRGNGLGGDGCRMPSAEVAVGGGGGGGIACVAGIPCVAIRPQVWEPAVSGGGAG